MPTSNENDSTTSVEKTSCHHERHLDGVQLKIYNLFWRLGRKTKDGSVAMTNAKVAEMIGRPLTGSKRPGGYITRAKSGLVKKGWLEFIGLEQDKKYRTWKGSRYRAIPHNGWVERKVRELGYDPCARLGAHIQ